MSKETIYTEESFKKDGNGRKVVVIGGGPAGLEAATLAAKKGFFVTLFEKSGRLGGCFDLPRKPAEPITQQLKQQNWQTESETRGKSDRDLPFLYHLLIVSNEYEMKKPEILML